MKRIISVLLCLTVIVSCFASCGSKGEDAGIVTPIDNDPKQLDPQIITDIGAQNIISNCFEGLVRISADGTVEPAAAESYSISDDGLKYTFKLRQDGKWFIARAARNMIDTRSVLGETTVQTSSDETTKGASESFDRNVYAQDFVFALKRALSPETICPYADSLMNIKNAQNVYSGSMSSDNLGVYATDRYTLIIELERKDGDFLYALTSTACMPCNEKFFNLTGGRYGLSTQYLMYNGPFYISNWADGTSISLRKSTTYRENAPDMQAKPASIYYSINSEQSTRDKKIENGTYDLAPLTQNQAAEFENNKRVAVSSFANTVTSFVFNCADAQMQNLNLRRAMTYAVDTSELLKSFGKKSALGVVPSACIVAGQPYRSKAQKYKTNVVDTDKAKTLLKSALEELDTNDLELKILCSSDNETVIRATMQQWQSVFGVNFGISVEAVDEATLKSRVESGEYQIAFCDVTYTDSLAKAAVSRFKSSARGNIAKFKDKKYDSIITKLNKTTGGSDTVSLIEQAESYLMSHCIMIPVFEKETKIAFAKGVSGVVLNSAGTIAYYGNTLRK